MPSGAELTAPPRSAVAQNTRYLLASALAVDVPARGVVQRRGRHHARAHVRRARGGGTARLVGGARRRLLVGRQRARHAGRRDQVPHQAQAQRQALQEARLRAPCGGARGGQPGRARRALRLRRAGGGRARPGRGGLALPVPGHADARPRAAQAPRARRQEGAHAGGGERLPGV